MLFPQDAPQSLTAQLSTGSSVVIEPRAAGSIECLFAVTSFKRVAKRVPVVESVSGKECRFSKMSSWFGAASHVEPPHCEPTTHVYTLQEGHIEIAERLPEQRLAALQRADAVCSVSKVPVLKVAWWLTRRFGKSAPTLHWSQSYQRACVKRRRSV